MQDLSSASGAILLPGLISPEVGSAFARAFWADLTEGRIRFGMHGGKLLGKNSVETNGENYAPLRALHWGFTPLIAQRLGKQLLPSHAYFRIYYRGDTCRIHSDRPDCQHSLSLTLALSDAMPWGLSIGTVPLDAISAHSDDFGEEPFETFEMGAGDAVLYAGYARRHGRMSPNANQWSAHAFLEWVDRDGPFASEALALIESAGQARD